MEELNTCLCNTLTSHGIPATICSIIAQYGFDPECAIRAALNHALEVLVHPRVDTETIEHTWAYDGQSSSSGGKIEKEKERVIRCALVGGRLCQPFLRFATYGRGPAYEHWRDQHFYRFKTWVVDRRKWLYETTEEEKAEFMGGAEACMEANDHFQCGIVQQILVNGRMEYRVPPGACGVASYVLDPVQRNASFACDPDKPEPIGHEWDKAECALVLLPAQSLTQTRASLGGVHALDLARRVR